jgi:hypothetical protein
MTLREYFEQFVKQVSVEPGYGVTGQVAAEIAAGYEVGLTPEQMHRFLARRTQITSVAVALKSPTLSVDAIERILEARRQGAVYPKEVLARAFPPEEVHERFRSEVFGDGGA